MLLTQYTVALFDSVGSAKVAEIKAEFARMGAYEPSKRTARGKLLRGALKPAFADRFMNALEMAALAKGAKLPGVGIGRGMDREAHVLKFSEELKTELANPTPKVPGIFRAPTPAVGKPKTELANPNPKVSEPTTPDGIRAAYHAISNPDERFAFFQKHRNTILH